MNARVVGQGCAGGSGRVIELTAANKSAHVTMMDGWLAIGLDLVAWAQECVVGVRRHLVDLAESFRHGRVST